VYILNMTEKIPLGILSLSLWNEAKAYILAAETLVRESQTDLPTYFLLSHALELTIKAYLVAHGVEAQELIDIGHDVQQAYDKAVALGFQIENQHAPALVRAISKFHKAFVFRYPVINKDGDLVVIRTLVKAEDVLEIVTAIWRRVEGEAIRARLLAAKGGGQYPVEEWHMGDSQA
jgi:hypothetical protein